MLTAEEEGGDNGSFQEINVRRSGRNVHSIRKPVYMERDTSNSETENDDSNSKEDSSEIEEPHLIPTVQWRERGKLGKDNLVKLGIAANHSAVTSEHLCGTGPALKLMIDEWIQLWDENSKVAALQLVNLILWVSGIEQDMTDDDFDNSDPASVLAELQESWEIPQERLGEYLLSVKNKKKMAKSMKKNFDEFWSRWVGSVLVNSEQVERAGKLVIGWLMTMSSSGYRPLRHVASLACFNILNGCSKSCSSLANQLDQASRLVGKSSRRGGERLVDTISAQLASLEKLVQMIFDGVFVQRFRDVDPVIRVEAVTSLSTWIKVYPEVFLDNSYLRYIGWALSDRLGVVRISALEAFITIYKDGKLREGMSAFLHRFLSRILEMAERDVELSVRNEACVLVKLLLCYNDENLNVKGQLDFLTDLIRYIQPLTREGLEALLGLVFSGESHEEYFKRAKAALYKVKSDHPVGEDPEMAVAYKLIKFIEELVETIPEERHQICIEHFVSNARGMLPVFRNLKLWIDITEKILQGDPITNSANSITDEKEWEDFFVDQVSPYPAMLLLEAIARYSFVYVNSMSDASRQMTNGLNNSNSCELADLLGSRIPTWINSIESSFDNLAPFFDLIGLADATVLAKNWTDPSPISAIEGLVFQCKSTCSAVAAVNLLRYWRSKHIDDDDGIALLMVRIFDSDLSTAERYSKMDIGGGGEFAWERVVDNGFWARIGVIIDHIPATDWPKAMETFINLLDKVKAYMEGGASLEYFAILESKVLPALLTAISSGIEECTEQCLQVLSNPNRFNQSRIVSSATTLKLLCKVSMKSSFKIDTSTEAKIIEFINFGNGNLANEEKDEMKEYMIASVFDLGRLYLTRCVSDASIVAVFRLYHHYCEGGVVASKCFLLFWDLIVSKVGEGTLSIIQKIIQDMYKMYIENVQYLKSIATLSARFGESLKSHPEIYNAEQLVDLHSKTIEFCISQTLSRNIFMVGPFLDVVLPAFTGPLGPNLANELLALLRRRIQINAQAYSKTLERLATRKVPNPRHSKSSLVRNLPSRLRQQVSSKEEEEGESDDNPDGFNQSEGMNQVYNDISGTPTKELASLRMSSEAALPPSSSPIPTRKRVIRP